MENSIEKGPELILTKEQVLDAISRIVEKITVIRELSNEQGLYLLEVETPRNDTGETVHYEYIRKGRYPDKNESSVTTIHAVFYEGDIPVGGQDVANFNDRTNAWEYTS